MIPVHAQNSLVDVDTAEQTDKGFLTELLEENLGGEGRIVRINGFRGAFSSAASISEITVADENGVWLSLKDVVLEWNRSALLRGRIEVEELTAAEVTLVRPPLAQDSDLPAAEAGGFALPNLPVSIQIDLMRIDRIQLGEAILGEATEMELEASGTLSGGSGAVALKAARTDGQLGEFIVDASYEETGQKVKLDLDLREAKNGTVARMLDLQGRPDLHLQVQGEGTLDDLVTQIALETDGEDRLRGDVVLKGTTEAGRSFAMDVGGDLSPLVPQEYRRFFGDNTSLRAKGQRGVSGALDLSLFELETEALKLNGELALNTEFWPTRIALDGQIGVPGNAPIVLPVSGGDATLAGAALTLDYDAKISDELRAQITVDALTSSVVMIERVELTAMGRLADALAAQKAIQVDVAFETAGLQFEDSNLQEAVGREIKGAVRVDYQSDGALALDQLRVNGADYGLTGDLVITGLAEEFETKINTVLHADRLARFSGLAGIDLNGRAEVSIDGTADLGGAFDLTVAGTTDDLAVGIAQADAALKGQTKLDLRAVRDTQGTRIPQLVLKNDQLTVSAVVDLKTNAADAEFDLTLANSAAIDPNLKGPISASGRAIQDSKGWRVDMTAEGPFNAQTSVNGRVTGDDPAVDFEVNLPNINQILPQYRGASRLAGRAEKIGNDWRIDTTLNGPYGLDGTLSGVVAGSAPNLEYALRIPNIAPLGAQISGALALQGIAVQQSAGWRVDTQLSGLSGTRAQLNGLVRNDGTLDLKTTGTAPLALANPFIAPRNIQGQAQFDISINGPADLSSVSGSLSTSGGRLSVPSFRIALNQINARADLNGGRVLVDVSAAVSSGGQLTLRGPISDLAGANAADLDIALNAVKLVDPTLYQTTLDGALNVRGRLTGGALIFGQIDIGETNIQIPSSQSAGYAIVPQISHINMPADARATLRRAGLNKSAQSQAGAASSPSYGLDVNINAPSRIFVRGRGLDAELGGAVSIRGRTDQVITSGRFSLLRGRLNILTKRFDLDEGSVVLQGTLDPYLRFLATTTTTVGTASITIEGRASEPEVTFSSTPEAPEEEVLAQIFFGRDVSQLSAFQALQLASAVATLADKGGEGLTSKLRRNFGLDDIDVTTDANGNTGVKLGKYISDNVYTDVTIGDSNTAGVSINIDLTPNLTVRGKVQSDGDTSIGLAFERDY